MNKLKQRNEIDSKYKWDLDSIYDNDQKLESDMKLTKDLVKKINKYKGHILESNKNLEESLKLYFELSSLSSKLYVYAVMKTHEDTRINKNQIVLGKMDNLFNTINSETAFFTPELLSQDYDIVLKYINQNSNLETYKFYLEDMYREKAYTLSVDQEELLSKLNDVYGVASDVFDKINNTDIKFSKFKDENGKTVILNSSNYSKYIESYDRRVRRIVFKKLYQSYVSLKNTFAKTLSSDIKVDTAIAKIRGYDSVLQMSLYNDNIDTKLYDKLINTVSNRLDIVYRYINVRKKVLNLDKIHMYDLYVPLVSELNNNYSYLEGRKIVKDALKPLGEEYQNVLDKAFLEKWIDVYYNEGKKSGAYSWGSYDTKPFLLLNYEDNLNSVSTMAHELGHSIHSYYSNLNNPFHDAEYSIFLAEVASTVNEILLNKYLYNNAKTKDEKLYYLNDLLDSFRTTLIRQTMFAEFEKIVHEKESKGAVLTEEEFSKIYLKLNKKYYGRELVHDKEIKYEWMRIPHFYNSFYVYKYATGIAVAARIVKDILGNKDKSLDNYLEFLKSGGNDYPLNILKKVGIDIVNDNTIDDALDMFNETLNEFIKVLES